MIRDWSIQHRATCCASTGKIFEEDEFFYTALYQDPATGVLQRQDYCESAWIEILAKIKSEEEHHRPSLFSFWRSKFVPSAQSLPETLPQENAESLLRKLLSGTSAAEGSSSLENERPCYLLALMLERKRILKPIAPEQVQTVDIGSNPLLEPNLLYYEHAKTGEVFLIKDPKLRLGQLEEVQKEVSEKLAAAFS